MLEKKSDAKMLVEAGKLIKANIVRRTSKTVCLHIPGSQSRAGSLTLKKENGTVKGFEYRCICGHTDAFVCE